MQYSRWEGYAEAMQSETYIYIATERLVPLSWHVRRKTLAEETIKWGLYSVAVRIPTSLEISN